MPEAGNRPQIIRGMVEHENHAQPARFRRCALIQTVQPSEIAAFVHDRRVRNTIAGKPFIYLFGAPFGRRNQRGMTMTKFIKLIRNNKGATAIEYGLIAALIAVAAIAAMQNIGSKLGETFNNVSDEL